VEGASSLFSELPSVLLCPKTQIYQERRSLYPCIPLQAIPECHPEPPQGHGREKGAF